LKEPNFNKTRKLTDKKIYTRVSIDIKNKIESLAKKHNAKEPEIIRTILEAYLND